MKKNIPEQTIKLAKARYMGHEPLSKIAKELEVPRSSLQYYVNLEWKHERELAENEVISAFADSRISVLNKISKHSADIILKSLESLKNRDKPPSVIEARAAVTIFESLDKIMRLDKGSPTDIIGETKPMTIIELKKEIAQLDPFYKEEDEEIITVIEPNTTTDSSDTESGDS
jgi:predicted HTH domain antitoxin